MFTRECPKCHEAAAAGGSPGGVMDWGFPSNLPESRLPRLFLLIFILIMAVRCEGCKVDKCSREYERLMDERDIPSPEPSTEFCQVARDYLSCLRGTARSCRGNLNYHSTMSTLGRLGSEFNCPRLLTNITSAGHVPLPSSSSAPPRTTNTPAPKRECTYQGRHRFKHCGLFGDPHLKTFKNEYQTCRVRGAWPLIDNPYIGVQVTNEPVVDGSPATATTKVTIIIRGRSTPCADEKTYEAASDASLPATFIDGTQRSGPDASVVLTVHEQQRIEIYVRYIETTLIVRQAGRYLAFSARMPEELVNFSGGADGDFSDSSLQLCVRGCPASERLDPISERGHKLPWNKAMERCRRSDSNEVTNNLTDHYLDWCVFDVMTTGDGASANDFAAAAHSAQADVLRLDPSSLKNKTTTHREQNPYYSHASLLRSPNVILVLLGTVFQWTRGVL
ncbi:RGM domain family member B-like isoform X2 [Zootermopsis nevadensis]|uniref:RGM domain family member B-like isoform X2 n=1 Tax=Zootermopsis nevadensis TaxID=136037 RepID=UPI000B8E22E6|nr:RGM domain family member B-like isoform X2 [Zootermopsis nevadensis]